MWILQEGILSGSAMFILGYLTIGPMDVFALFLEYGHSLRTLETASGGISLQYMIGCRDEVGQLMGSLCDTLLGLRTELLRSRIHATDPKDYVYGTLGIQRDMPFAPNYSMSIAEVYHQAALHVLQEHRSLEILWLCDGCVLDDEPMGTLGLPSWVPDWSRPLPRPPVFHLQPRYEGFSFDEAKPSALYGIDRYLSLIHI